jgi:hypothetical protein
MPKLPILFINFNRPDLSIKVLSKIIEYEPERLYISCDGPRSSNDSDKASINEVKANLLNIPKSIIIKTRFLEQNLGCKRAVSSAIDWFFQNELEGIILEDDTLPNKSFFVFCEQMIERFRNEEKIGIVSGDNFFIDNYKIKESYYFSKFTHIWGWATWRRVWETYNSQISESDLNHKDWRENLDSEEISYWEQVFSDFKRNDVDTWDHQLTFSNFLHQRLNIMPSVNLISNIGFREDATHTKHNSELANLPTEELSFPLIHPKTIKENRSASEFSRRFFVQSKKQIEFRIYIKEKINLLFRKLIKIKELLYKGKYE